MWLPRRWRPAPWVVRLGRKRVMLYRREGGMLAWSGSGPIAPRAWEAQRPNVGAITEALGSLLTNAQSDDASGDRRAILVLESACLPVIWIPLAAPVLSETTLHALIRHRLALVWGSPGDASSDWQLRVDYRPGDAAALAFALAPQMANGLTQAAAGMGWSWASLQPAFAWAWSTQRKPAEGWHVCVEQDRALVAQWQGGAWRAFDPAAPLAGAGVDTLAHWRACARRESHRRGLHFDPAGLTVLDAWRERHGASQVGSTPPVRAAIAGKVRAP